MVMFYSKQQTIIVCVCVCTKNTNLSVMLGDICAMRTSAAPPREPQHHTGGRVPWKCCAACSSCVSRRSRGTTMTVGRLEKHKLSEQHFFQAYFILSQKPTKNVQQVVTTCQASPSMNSLITIMLSIYFFTQGMRTDSNNILIFP